MRDLHGFGLRGHLPIFIVHVVKDRSFKIRVGSTFSDSRLQEMGVPQGSILSVTLFSVKINSITQCLKPGVDCSLYVDDFQICYRSSNMSIIERQLQLCLNKLQKWATDNGFRFSNTKTLYAYLLQKRSQFRSTAFSGQVQYLPLAFVSSSFQLLPTLSFLTFWKHLHISSYYLGVSNHRRL